MLARFPMTYEPAHRCYGLDAAYQVHLRFRVCAGKLRYFTSTRRFRASAGRPSPEIVESSRNSILDSAIHHWSKRKSMTKIYCLLSKRIESRIGLGRWIKDESLPLEMPMRDEDESCDLHRAAEAFADPLVKNEFGENYSACVVSLDERMPNGGIFKVQPGEFFEGSYLLEEPIWFAVSVRHS
jgi:hypothetical protein